MLGKKSRVDVLMTKYDLWREQHDANDFKEFLEHVEASFVDDFAPRVARLRFSHIAARAEKCSDLPTAYRLDGMFPSWVQEVGAVETRPERDPAANATREFDRYLFRRFRTRV